MAIGVTRPKYIIRDGEMLVVPPVGLEVQLHLFVVEADKRRLQQLCDREINLCPDRRYQPLGGFVVFYAAEMVNLVPSGRIAERDFGVWVPVLGATPPAPPRLLSYTPYLWVDSSPALVGGRLVFGFPKHGAALTLPIGDTKAATVVTPVMRWQGGSAEAAELLRIRRDGGGRWDACGDAWETVEAAAQSLRMLGIANLVRFARSVSAQAGLPMVFLKQMPAADGSWDAVYQAVLEADVDVVAGATGAVLQGSYEVEILDCWSHDLVGRLGLKTQRRSSSGQSAYQHVFCAFGATLQFKAVVRPGVVVCQRTGGVPPPIDPAQSTVEQERANARWLARWRRVTSRRARIVF